MIPRFPTAKALVIGLTAAVLGLAAGVVVALNNQSPEPFNGMLLSPNRTQLKICVQAVDVQGQAAPAAAQRISQALADVARHPRWSESGYGRSGPPSVEVGCPGEPYLLRQGVIVVDGVPSTGWIVPEVAEPSVYRVFVFILSPKKLSSVIRGSYDVRVAPQEAMCHGSVCFDVTTGLYLTGAEIENRAFLTDWLVKGLNLEPPILLVPDNLQPRGDPNAPKPRDSLP